MKKLDYLLLYFYSLMVVAVICHTIFHFVGFQWGKLLSNLSLLQSFLFMVFSLTLALTALVVLIIKITQFVTVHAVQQKVESILTASQRKEIAPKELNQQLDLLDSKLLRLEENLQKSENRVMRNEEEIVENYVKKSDILMFLSSSTFKNFWQNLKNKNLLNKKIIASIGPVTTKTIQNLGCNVQIEAKRYTEDGLFEEILKYKK